MNFRLTILLVAVLAIVGASAIYYWANRPDEEHVNREWLYKISDSDIVQIEVTYQQDHVKFVKSNPPGSSSWIWLIDDNPPVQVYGPKWSGTPFLLGGPQIERELPEAKEPLSSYGLDPPISVIKVTEKGGYVFEFHLGSTTPDNTSQYVKLTSETSIFTVAEMWARVINDLAVNPPYPPAK